MHAGLTSVAVDSDPQLEQAVGTQKSEIKTSERSFHLLILSGSCHATFLQLGDHVMNDR